MKSITFEPIEHSDYFVYVWIVENTVRYIGMTKYFPRIFLRFSMYKNSLCRLELYSCSSKKDAKELEKSLIRSLSPVDNTDLKWRINDSGHIKIYYDLP
jgi:hypothetical protein